MFRWRSSDDFPLIGRPSALGLLLGALCFAASLSPSLVPRTGMVQGALGGICFAAGYLIGYLIVALAKWLFERGPRPLHIQHRNLGILGGFAVLIGAYGLLRVTEWQNGIHAAMGLAPVESARPWTILGVALLLGGGLVLSGRLFRRLWRVITAQLEAFVPPRLAATVGLGLAAALVWSVGNDVVIVRILAAMDKAYAAVDDVIPSDRPAPIAAAKTGSEASLIDWGSLGAEGRNWIYDGPDAGAIRAFNQGGPSQEPLRIYVGLNSAKSPKERALLALEEAKRVGAFERSYLVLGSPTGTGWMDPAAMQPLDYLTGGDVATVGVQYSYLPSWLTLMVNAAYGAETSQEVFRAFYDYWHALPRETRPKLYLFGLSLGARNGEMAVWLPELLGDPMQGALWVGPPFASDNWRQVVDSREEGSLSWAPKVRDGSVIRVTTQENMLQESLAPWGDVRMVYLVYPSDPIALFTADSLWRKPDWLKETRAPDVSPQLRWWPVVTFLQVALDMATATTPPKGVAHVYAARHYLMAWNEVLGTNWRQDRLDALADLLDQKGL